LLGVPKARYACSFKHDIFITKNELRRGNLARCGYRDYAAVTEMFEALRPTDGGGYAPGQKDK
jgi:hypothetical protein